LEKRCERVHALDRIEWFAASSLRGMADADPKKISRELRRSQTEFERAQSKRDKASTARRASFERAREAGFSLRDIGRETGLHFSRVAEILKGK
jgi:chromosome condensin MukBEF ATPase and DNA-binding subunit MukB